MPTTILSSLTAEVLDAVLSEFVFSATSADQHKEVIDHFTSLLNKSNLLRTAIDEWGRVARDEDRIGDLFTLAIFIGWRCRYQVEESRRLQRLLP